MAENLEKGRSLEKAVKFIQETILKSDPKLKGTEFVIETNNILTISGVRHEVDVLVKTLPNSLYEASWIFECKNWKEPVGKNEIIILAEKVNASKANKGFLVARSITKDAEAQLHLDTRLSFVQCTDDFASPLNNLELIHVDHELFPVRVLIKQRGVPPSDHPREMDWKTIKCRLNGEATEFGVYIKTQLDQMIAEDQKANEAKYQHEAKHWGKQAIMIEFDKGELVLDDMEVEHMAIYVQFLVTVCKQRIVSKFELKGQGRAFHFEPIDDFMPGKRLEVRVVELL